MADPGFPGQHTTTTTVQTTNTTVQTTLRFDPSYLRTIPGMLKCAQVVINILGFICIEASGYHAGASRGTYFNTVSMTAFWFTGIILVFYLFHLIEKSYRIPWIKIELGFCAIWTCLYLIAASLAISFYIEAYVAAGFFGFCGMVLYGIDAFLKYRAMMSGQLAQGERVINKQTTTLSNTQY
ncbi:unnamed protein product [Phaedon cochleariae]|uniref:MARVEL domain-containing protein n=1 Tax=Phaedon cochleariae TaxID=80249 RepID=A0A9N9WY10_PHACE|nr:unnamed protein product [Phaedon cochleariae]